MARQASKDYILPWRILKRFLPGFNSIGGQQANGKRITMQDTKISLFV
jgi:hypothetical protein